MKIASNYNQANFNGLGKFANKGIKYKPIIWIQKPKPKMKTVVVLPDGTIDRSLFAKIRERIDEFIEKILLKIVS